MLRFNKRSGEDHLLRFARAMGMRYGRAPASEEHMLRFGRAAGGPDQGRKEGDGRRALESVPYFNFDILPG